MAVGFLSIGVETGYAKDLLMPGFSVTEVISTITLEQL